jgi:fucose permease
LLYVGFVFTGIGTTLLGCVLPNLSTMWRMNDDQSGILFAAQFSGSALGALLVGNNFSASVERGYLLLIASALSIPFFPHFPEGPRFFGFGLGLGLAMTATSMLIGTMYAGKRGSALSLLNGFWAAGAALCPALTSLWISRWPPTYLFLVLAVGMAVIFILIARSSKANFQNIIPLPGIGTRQRNLRVVFVFAILGSLYVGVESSIGGWMMTYVHRLPVANGTWAPAATSFFWAALLCGRMLAPIVLRQVSEAHLLNVSLAFALVSAGLLVLSHSPITILFTAAMAGLMLGPIFPLFLAKALASLNDSPNAKWVFSISGFGGAILPWITGKVSAQSGSLRIGLVVPVLALAAMIILNHLEPASEFHSKNQ